MTKTYQDLLAEAYDQIATLPTELAMALVDDPDTLIVDLRDRRELEREGKIAGAFHCPRGMLEFWIDPGQPLPQTGLGRGQTDRILLRFGVALGPGHQNRTGHGV